MTFSTLFLLFHVLITYNLSKPHTLYTYKMDLSWCIICDRHCVEENVSSSAGLLVAREIEMLTCCAHFQLYCSETCRVQDVNHKHASSVPASTNASPLCSPPASPLLDPYFSSFNHERRTSITISKSTRVHHDAFGYMSPSSVPRYSLSE